MATRGDEFNLPAPPGFRGFDEHLPLRIYRRNLPHWRQEGATYAVTFRFDDALPQSTLQALKRWRLRWEADHPPPRSQRQWAQYAKEVTHKTERWLDEGYGECHLRNPIHATMMAGALQFYETTRCSVGCFIVMPNHIHAVMRPLLGHELEDVLQVIKGWSAHQINLAKGTRGELWTAESYDRIIRDEEHLYRVIQYIGRNGRVAGLSTNEYLRYISPEWQAAGWDFVDPPAKRE